jgi:hypothetical protein
MTQYATVIKVMEEKGGFSTLGQLYQTVDVKNWKTKTPFASIRRIVQNEKFFFKIKPGLWALNSYKDRISELIPLDNSKSTAEKEIFNHSYYQGLIVEIGNFKGYSTFIPNQDKNKKFLNNTLGKCATLGSIHKFTYDEIIDRAKTIDVIWFDNRKFPQSFFEVEHSTDFQNSFVKMLDLKSFYAHFNIVADEKRYREYEKKISYSTFSELRNRIKFISYEKLSEYHSKSFEYFTLNKELQI